MLKVRCPCKVVEEIDWDYMQEFIEKIKAELIDGMDIETILRKVIIKMP